ncbi:MAG: FecR domain-containing protein [Bacteroidota bacterium]
MDHQFLEGYSELHYQGREDSNVDQELKVLYEITGQEPDLLIDTDQAWQEFSDQITPVRELPKSSTFPTWLRVAAVLLVGTFLGIVSYNYLEQPSLEDRMVAIDNTSENVKAYQLPDGSTVWLRKGAAIRYAQDFDSRAVAFTGEGYFEVEKGQGEFSVSTDYGLKIVVLGTEFGVNTTTTNTMVLVTEGLVSLSSGKSVQELSAGETGVHYKAKQKVLKSGEDQTNALAWKTGHFKFSDTNLQEAVTLLNSFYPSAIVIKDSALKNCRINGEFKDQSLKDILEDLSFILSINVESSDNSFILSGDGC